MSQSDVQALKSINVLLQYLAPVVILIAAALSIRGEKWDIVRNRPTRVGWWILLVALCTMAVSIGSSLLSNRLKRMDAENEKRRYDGEKIRYEKLLAAERQVADDAKTEAERAQKDEKRAKDDLDFLKQRVQSSLSIQHEQLSAVQRTLAVSEESYLAQFLVDRIELSFSGGLDDAVAVLHNVVGNELKLNIRTGQC